MDEGMHAEHHRSVAAAQRAATVHPEYSSLRKVVPAAAAFAVATAAAAQAEVPDKGEGPAIHKDFTEEAHGMDGQKRVTSVSEERGR